MIFEPLPLAGAFRIDLEPREDERGFFARVFCRDAFAAHGLAAAWTQINTSFTSRAGTVRGMHFQRPPSAEAKLIKCLRGALYDVLVDLRAGSPTFGHWTALELTAENRRMAYVPKGVAHGFQTLAADTEILYFHDTDYGAADEGGVSHADPGLAIRWPLPVASLSKRDAALPPLASVEPIAL
jgi:dTDP-4-dehydrorhamnose 3,5-epimerase